MWRVLKFVPAVEVPRPGAEPALARRVLHAVLLRVAERAAQLAAQLDAVEVRARAPAKAVAAVRTYAPAGAFGVKLAEAVALLAVAGYFVAGLAGLFVA